MPLLIGVVLLTVREPVNVESLQRAIRIWETCLDIYLQNIKDIKTKHKLTWWARPSFWHNDNAYSRSFQALIKRRIQLQTAIKEKENSNGR